MKKIISLLLSLALVFSLAGCSNTDKTEGSNSYTDSQSVLNSVASQITEDDSSQTSSDNRSEAQPAATPKPTATPEPTATPKPTEKPAIDKDGHFFDKKNVALYIHTYGELPANFITKDEARDLGWDGGSVEKYAPGYAIGGDRFGNYEGQLPKKKGRVYYECDIDTDGYHSRGSRRIVFSNDGLIYYTHDHYENFELLYGEE